MSKSGKKRKNTVKKIHSIANESAPTYYVESYKMLATNIEFIAVAQECKNIMITSSLESEGKTNCSVNLSLALTGYGKKVCLVDCDLRRPSIHRLKRHPVGLTNVLKGESTLDDAVFRYQYQDKYLNVLLAGAIPPNPAELLASKKMQKVINELSERFDYIIYDTPPCLGISDVSVLGRYMDAAILVVKHNSTDKRIAERAKANLDNAGVKVIGAILSGYEKDSDVSDSYYYSCESYYGESDD